MYRATNGLWRVMVIGVICLALIASNVPTAEASSATTQYPRGGCWLLCW